MLNKKKKKKKGENIYVQAVHSLILSVGIKATFDLFDRPTAPGVLRSQCIHKHINYQTTITDDLCYLLVYRKKDSEVLIF